MNLISEGEHSLCSCIISIYVDTLSIILKKTCSWINAMIFQLYQLCHHKKNAYVSGDFKMKTILVFKEKNIMLEHFSKTNFVEKKKFNFFLKGVGVCRSLTRTEPNLSYYQQKLNMKIIFGP